MIGSLFTSGGASEPLRVALDLVSFAKTLCAPPAVRVSRWLGTIWPVAGFEWLTSTEDFKRISIA